MEPIVSRESINEHALNAARCLVWGNGSIANPWPEGTGAHAEWQAEYDRLVGEIQAGAA